MRLQVLDARTRRYVDAGPGAGAHAPIVDLVAAGDERYLSRVAIHQRLNTGRGEEEQVVLLAPNQTRRFAQALIRAIEERRRQVVAAGPFDERGSRLIVDADASLVRITGLGSRQPGASGAGIRCTHALAREIQADLDRLAGLVRYHQAPSEPGEAKTRVRSMEVWRSLRGVLVPYPHRRASITGRAARLSDRYGLPTRSLDGPPPPIDQDQRTRLVAGQTITIHTPMGLLLLAADAEDEPIRERTVALRATEREALLAGQGVEVRVGTEAIPIDPAHLDGGALADRLPVTYELPDVALRLVEARLRRSTDVIDTESLAAILLERRPSARQPDRTRGDIRRLS